jgi:hypothetical protein
MLAKLLTLMDFVGKDISLLHKTSKRVKTVLGGLLTAIISVFSIYSIIYFGRDLFQKENPYSRFSKAYSNSSRVSIKDRPFVFYFSDAAALEISHLDRYVTVTGKRYITSESGDTDISLLYVEPCDRSKHLLQYDDLFHDMNFANTWCADPKKVKYANGTVGEEDNIFVENEYVGYPSIFIVYLFNTCVNTTENGNKCAPQAEIDNFESNLFLNVFLVDEYIDLNRYHNPSSKYLNTLTINITPKVHKNTHVVYKNAYITTDNGLIMEDPDTINLSQIETIKTDLGQSVTGYYKFYFESNRITDNYFRKYVKVQDLVASIGGLIKFIYVFSAMLLYFYSDQVLNFDIATTLYTEVEEKVPNLNLTNNLQGSNNELKEISVNRLVGNRVIYKPLEHRTGDYFKALLRCKSRYTKSNYERFRELIRGKFELTYIFKKLQDLDNLAGLVLDNQQKMIFTNKKPLRIDRNKVMEDITVDRTSLIPGFHNTENIIR